jgi:hypothetical protein
VPTGLRGVPTGLRGVPTGLRGVPMPSLIRPEPGRAAVERLLGSGPGLDGDTRTSDSGTTRGYSAAGR